MTNTSNPTEHTLSLLRTYTTPSVIERDAQTPRFIPCPNISLHLMFTGPYENMSFERRRGLSRCKKDDITNRFVADGARWVSALRSLPGIGRLEKLRIRVEQNLARMAWEKNVGGFVRDITRILWDAVGKENREDSDRGVRVTDVEGKGGWIRSRV